MEIKNIIPQQIWKNFDALNAVPRPSKKEERVIAFMVEFGEKLGLETIIDPIRNVIIRKPATKGMENRKRLVLQSHLDMVHQKNADTNFDFDKEGIKMYIDGDWVKAKGTTLGADNGLGVAAIMGILESTDIPHPELEALFTIDEETGMTGALGLQGGYLKGDILLNLDTEDDDEISIGCAGGVDVNVHGTYELEAINTGVAYQIVVNGLNGGHSGMDIHKGLGNANKIMNRILFEVSRSVSLQVAEIDGGGLRNAIPRESRAVIVVNDTAVNLFEKKFSEIVNTIVASFESVEQGLKITAVKKELPRHVMAESSKNQVIQSIYAAHNGVFAMSASIPDLVETSNNVARVLVKEGKIEILCLTRSSLEAGKQDLANALTCTFELAGYTVSTSGDYPGWQPNLKSSILEVVKNTYIKLFNEKPRVMACHAGLECGILGTNYPEMEMVSFGPNIRGAHSPDEKVSISSCQKFWKFLLEIIAQTPIK